MKYWAAVLLLATTCCGSHIEHPRVPVQVNVADEVVALVRTDGSKFCGGVWVDGDHILTASHCLDETDEANVETVDHHAFTAEVEWVDRRRDLMLLYAHNFPPHHQAHLASDAHIGENVVALGHPMGRPWVFAQGQISNFISHKSPRDPGKMDMIVVDANILPGNSGGGIFNDHGELVGICSMKSSVPSPRGYFVSLSEIRAFLGDAGIR